MAEGGEHSPLEQFMIKPILEIQIGQYDVSLTNSSLFMILATAGITAFLTLSMSGRAMVPGRWQNLAEMSYEFVADIVRSTSGSEGMKYFPLVFSLFMYVLFCNLLGMMPYSFTVTSHIVVTFGLALVAITAVLIIGFARNGLGFLKLFAPSGVPPFLLILIIPIEVISFLTRPVSLAVRLFANMLAGHTMLKVFAGFVVGLVSLGGFGSLSAVVPLFASVAITGLEFLVAFLQAFIFAMLTSIYLNDALHPSH
ncbi:MAG: F0F1 ATP synthase subunit A [Alphaproteobacteria bacterium]